jgi:hypothetical protein
LRRYRVVGGSVAAHLALLLAIALHHPRVVELTPAWLAYGDGAHSYRVTYFPPNGKDAATEAKLILPPRIVVLPPLAATSLGNEAAG